MKVGQWLVGGQLVVGDGKHSLSMRTEMPSKEQKVEEVLRLKEEITRLLQNVRDSQALCEKYTHENDYLQDYIGSVMKSTDMK